MTHKSVKTLLEELNHMGESSRIEAKLGSEIGKSVLQTICAYANEPSQRGGYLLLGVSKGSQSSDDFPSYKAVGVNNPEKLKEDISSQCASEFNIAIRPVISEEMVGGKCVLKIFIPETQESDKPVYFTKTGLPKGAYRRIGASDMRCTDEDLELLYGNRSGNVYDQKIVEGATLDDIDPGAINLYRKLRSRVSESAQELTWSDTDLLQSLRCVTKDPASGNFAPTICGIVVFGKALALRRLFPMWRVDYIRVPGTTWINDPDNRFITLEIRESLLQTMMRAEAAILADIPKAFYLPEGAMQRQDIPLVPQRVIREALVNCLIHRNYAIQSPVQIIHYTNRLEFRNPGYSLAPDDRLGEPGSLPRNPSIATILHDLDFAETKGSGIRTMIALMKKHGLAPPTFISDRYGNFFATTLLFHHFLDERDIEWLGQFEKFAINDAQKKAMIYMRERDYIDNETYRRLNDVDTLEASQNLQYLRKKGLIEKEGKGNATHYKIASTSKTHMLESKTHMLDGKTHMLKGKTHMLDGKTHKLTRDELPEKIHLLISQLGKKSNTSQKINAVLALCRWKALTAEEICSYLNKKDTIDIVRRVLAPMVKEGLLELTIPESRKHPNQKYRTKRE